MITIQTNGGADVASDTINFAGFGSVALVGQVLTVNAPPVPTEWVGPPATHTSTGTPGQKAVDATYVYFCVSVNSWVRVAIQSSTF